MPRLKKKSYQQRRKAAREARRIRHLQETEEEAKKRRKAWRDYAKRRRESESTEQRALRLAAAKQRWKTISKQRQEKVLEDTATQIESTMETMILNRFPRDTEKDRRWETMVRPLNWKPTGSSRIYQATFYDNQYVQNRQNRKRLLKRTAISTTKKPVCVIDIMKKRVSDIMKKRVMIEHSNPFPCTHSKPLQIEDNPAVEKEPSNNRTPSIPQQSVEETEMILPDSSLEMETFSQKQDSDSIDRFPYVWYYTVEEPNEGAGEPDTVNDRGEQKTSYS